MWKYDQTTGDFYINNEYVETGYSGKKPDGYNNPNKECDKNIGPIPRGFYTIEERVDSPTAVTLPLKPDSPNYCSPKRDGFLIHGDSVSNPGTASTGCIILSKSTRDRVSKSADKRLQVVRNSVRGESLFQRIYAIDLER